MGGPSAEHDISLQSGLSVLQYLDRSRYKPRAVVISPQKLFFFCKEEAHTLTMDELSAPQASGRFQGPFSPTECAGLWHDCEVAFLALHGSFGEDGVIQGYCETLDIAYTGSGVRASAVAMDKIDSKYVFMHNDIPVPPFSVYGPLYPENTPETIGAAHGYPLFVKCPQSGSSKLMGQAHTLSQLKSLLQEYAGYSDRILIEQRICGREFSCPVLDKKNGDVTALPVIEIRPEGTPFFDFTAKYTPGACSEIVPAPVDDELSARIQEIAIRAHRAIGCSGISRVDMIYDEQTVFVLEINSLPGLTANSLIPKSFRSQGGTYAQLLDTMISMAGTHGTYA